MRDPIKLYVVKSAGLFGRKLVPYRGEKFDKPKIWLVFGARGSGKSSLLEVLAHVYATKNRACIVDLFGARDGESLAWLRHPNVKSGAWKALLLHSPRISVKAPCDLKLYEDFCEEDLFKYDVIISAPQGYADFDEELEALKHATKVIYNPRRNTGRMVFLLMREAASWVYSRIRVAATQAPVKAQLIHLLREARHMNMAVGFDTQRASSMASDVRDISDYIVFKKLTHGRLPESLRFIFEYFDLDTMYNLGVDTFVFAKDDGKVGCGIFEKPAWHLETGEALSNLGIEFKEEPGLDEVITSRELVQLIMQRMDIREIAAYRKISNLEKRGFLKPIDNKKRDRVYRLADVVRAFREAYKIDIL